MSTVTDTDTFDVVAVNQASLRVRLLAERKSKARADAIVSMAVARRGVDTEFFAVVPSGTYKPGDKWNGGAA